MVVCTAATQYVREQEGWLAAKGVKVVLKPFVVDDLELAVNKALRLTERLARLRLGLRSDEGLIIVGRSTATRAATLGSVCRLLGRGQCEERRRTTQARGRSRGRVNQGQWRSRPVAGCKTTSFGGPICGRVGGGPPAVGGKR